MFFKPNLPAYERAIRGCAGLGMIAAAWAVPLPPWATWLLLVGGAAAVSTALVAFCPACAMVGRRMD